MSDELLRIDTTYFPDRTPHDHGKHPDCLLVNCLGCGFLICSHMFCPGSLFARAVALEGDDETVSRDLDVCLDCASVEAEKLGARMLGRARELRREAQALQWWADRIEYAANSGRIQTPHAAFIRAQLEIRRLPEALDEPPEE